jgi:hypothetical protein
MSTPDDPIKCIEAFAGAHPNGEAELVGGLVYVATNDPLFYDTSDFMRYARQVAEDELAGRHEDAVREELVRLSHLFPGPKHEDKE